MGKWLIEKPRQFLPGFLLFQESPRILVDSDREKTSSGRQIIHIFDLGYAGTPWLVSCLESDCRFILRFPKHHRLHTSDGPILRAWKVLLNRTAWGECVVKDTVQNKTRILSLLATLARIRAILAIRSG